MAIDDDTLSDTTSGFDRLLAALDADRDEAGRKFEALRRRLERFFDWRGASAPDECADITLDRLAAKIGAGVHVESMEAYTFAIARLVFMEQARRPGARTVSLDDAPNDALSAQPAASTAWSDCLERCLQALPADQQRLILRYYAHARRDKIVDRAALAAELGIAVSALRNRAQRLRDKLATAVSDCVQQRETT